VSEYKEFWIAKGTSNFADELGYDCETGEDRKHTCEFYDLISESDTIKNGTHVIEHQAVLDKDKQIAKLKSLLSSHVTLSRLNDKDRAEVLSILQND